jgi:hypothetical protein
MAGVVLQRSEFSKNREIDLRTQGRFHLGHRDGAEASE